LQLKTNALPVSEVILSSSLFFIALWPLRWTFTNAALHVWIRRHDDEQEGWSRSSSSLNMHHRVGWVLVCAETSSSHPNTHRYSFGTTSGKDNTLVMRLKKLFKPKKILMWSYIYCKYVFECLLRWMRIIIYTFLSSNHRSYQKRRRSVISNDYHIFFSLHLVKNSKCAPPSMMQPGHQCMMMQPGCQSFTRTDFQPGHQSGRLLLPGSPPADRRLFLC
jgi:hypothetical protein